MQAPKQEQNITINVADLASSDSADVIRVLHVDDDPCILEVSKEILMTEGNFEIDQASCVDEALKELETNHYDAVISDYEMPPKNGLQFLKELREKKNEIPFILFTGKGREDVAIKALNLGVDAYINKAGATETVYGELTDALRKTLERKRSKKLLADSEIKYRTLIEDMSQGVVIVQGPLPHIVFANSAMEKMTGFSSQELCSFTPTEIAELIHPDDREAFLNRLSQRLSGEKQETAYEFKGIRKDGSMTWLEVCSSLIEYNGQRVVQGVFLDITQRKNAELKLMESELKYRSIFDNNEAAMFRGKIDGGVILDCNEKFLSRLGCTSEEVRGNPSIPYWADPLQRQEMVRLLKAQGHVEHFEFKMLNRQGEVKTCLTSARLYSDGIVEGSIVDITDRKRAELELEQKYEALERATESIGAGLAIIGKDYRVVWANAILRNLGVSSIKKCYQTFNNLEAVCPDCGVKKVFEQNVPFEIHEYKTVNSEGEVIWVELRVTPLKDKNGNVTAALELVVPINERKRAEEALKESEESYHSLSSAAFEGVGISREGIILDANSQFAEMLGYEVSELIGKNVSDLVAPESLDLVRESIQKGFEGPYEHLAIRKDGSAFPVEIRARLITYKGHPARVSVIRDITELKKAKEELENNENYFETLMTSVLSGIIVVDSETHDIVDANPAALSLIGASKEEVVGKVCHKFICPAEIGKCPITDLGQTVDKAERTIISANGERHPVIKSVVKAKHNGKTLLVENFVDISTLKKIEDMMKKNQNRLELMNEKLKVVGVLTRHDVRNKLSAINGYSYLLKKKHADKPDIVDGLSKMEQSVKDSVRMFEFARAYEQLGVEELVDVNVERTVNQAVGMFSDLTFKVINDCHGLTVRADSLLRQLLYNLVDNTRKYGEKTTVARVYYEEKVQGNLQLIYEDDGVGIPLENKGQLFKQGFSTGGSTGFGLFLSQKIMEVYGWAMTEEGEPGKGAKFVITIPSQLLGHGN